MTLEDLVRELDNRYWARDSKHMAAGGQTNRDPEQGDRPQTGQPQTPQQAPQQPTGSGSFGWGSPQGAQQAGLQGQPYDAQASNQLNSPSVGSGLFGWGTSQTAQQYQFDPRLGGVDYSNVGGAGVGMYSQTRQGQQALASMLMDQAQGKGPTAADQQLQNASDANIRQAMAVGQSQQGLSPQTSARNILDAQAQSQQQAAGQSAQLKAQEQLSGQQQLAGIYGQEQQGDLAQQQAALQQRQQNIGMSNAQQQALLNAQNLESQNFMATQDLTANNLGHQTSNQQAGMQAAGNIGTSVANVASLLPFSVGGEVPGDKEYVGGDDPKMDTVKALLSPGEIVVPHSKAHDPDQAAEFARAIASRKKDGKKSGFMRMMEVHKDHAGRLEKLEKMLAQHRDSGGAVADAGGSDLSGGAVASGIEDGAGPGISGGATTGDPTEGGAAGKADANSKGQSGGSGKKKRGQLPGMQWTSFASPSDYHSTPASGFVTYDEGGPVTDYTGVPSTETWEHFRQRRAEEEAPVVLKPVAEAPKSAPPRATSGRRSPPLQRMWDGDVAKDQGTDMVGEASNAPPNYVEFDHPNGGTVRSADPQKAAELSQLLQSGVGGRDPAMKARNWVPALKETVKDMFSGWDEYGHGSWAEKQHLEGMSPEEVQASLHADPAKRAQRLAEIKSSLGAPQQSADPAAGLQVMQPPPTAGAPAQRPSGPAPGGAQGATERAINRSASDQEDIMRQRGEAAAVEGGRQASNTYDTINQVMANEEHRRAAYQQYQAARDDRMKQQQAIIDQYSKAEIDPQRYWAKKGTFSHVLAVLGAGLGGNIKSITDGIDRDIEAQRTNLETRKGAAAMNMQLLGVMRNNLGDDVSSLAATRATMLQTSAMTADMFAKKYQGTDKGLEYQQTAAGLRGEQAKELQKLKMDAELKGSEAAKNYAEAKMYRDKAGGAGVESEAEEERKAREIIDDAVESVGVPGNAASRKIENLAALQLAARNERITNDTIKGYRSNVGGLFESPRALMDPAKRARMKEEFFQEWKRAKMTGAKTKVAYGAGDETGG